MTVKLDIGANPDQVVGAFNQIKRAAAETRQAMADLASIDMSHPELDALQTKVDRLNAAFAQMRTMTEEGTRAASARASAAAAHGAPLGAARGPAGWPAGTGSWAQPPGPPPGSSGWPAGTGSWAQPPGAPGVAAPPAPPPPPPIEPGPRPRRESDDEEGGGGGGGLGSIIGLLRGPIGFALSLAGVGGAAKMVGQGVEGAQSERVGTDHLLRTLRDSSLDFDKFRDSLRTAAGGIASTFGDTERLVSQYAHTAGSDIGNLVDRTEFAGSFARGYGLDRSEGVGVMARAENAGIDPKQLAAAIGDVLQQGGLQGRQDEVAKAITRFGETVTRQTVTDAHFRDFADMYTGLNATGFAGFRGPNAEAMIGSLNTTISHGGAAGQASQIFASRAMAAHGVRGLYAQQYLLDGGAFQNLSERGGDNTTVLDAQIDLLNRDYGPNSDNVEAMDRKASALSGITGWGTHQSLEFLKHYHKGDTGKSLATLRKANIDPSKVNGSAWAEISEVAGSNLSALPSLRDRALKRADLTDADRAELGKGSGESLRDTLTRVLAAHGMTETPGSRQEQITADFANSLTRAADRLVDPLNGLREGVGKLTDEFNKGIEQLGKWLGVGADTNRPSGASGIIDPLAGDGVGRMQADDISSNIRQVMYRMPAGGGGRFSGGGGSGQPLLSSPEVAARAKQAMAFFESKGWSHEAAAGIVSNLVNESGLREGAIGDNGQARGLMQWHGDRFADVAAGTGNDPTSSFMAGLAGVNWELLHGHDAGMRDTGQYLSGGTQLGRWAPTSAATENGLPTSGAMKQSALLAPRSYQPRRGCAGGDPPPEGRFVSSLFALFT